MDGHSFNLDKTYGYSTAKTQKEFMDSFAALYENEVIPAISRGLCATVYTQVSDVEDETNGLLTYDRQICKVDEDRMQKIALDLKDAFTEATK